MAEQFLCLPELRLVFLECIDRDTATLARLCRVNKAFHSLFKSILYECVWFPLASKHFLSRAANVPDPGVQRWALTKSLFIRHIDDLGYPETPFAPHGLNKGLLNILQHTSNLESYCSSGADISHRVMDQLSKTPTLRRIRISFGSPLAIGIRCCERDDRPDVWAKHGPLFGRPQLHLRALSNLTSLALVEMFGDLPPWQEAIANILSQSPNLQSLTLSFSYATYERTLTLDSGPHQLQTFTDGLCDIYAAKTKHRLRLKRLKFDDYIHCPSLECIEKVLDLSVLEEVFIFNQILEFLHFETHVEFLAADKTAALRALEFYDLDADVWGKIESFCDGSRDFMLSFANYPWYDENFDNEYNMYSLFQEHPSAVIYELGLPASADIGRHVSTLALLHGHTPLRNLLLPISVHKLAADESPELEGCMALVATLPNLQGLWLLTYKWKQYPVESYAPAVLKIATSSPSLSYIRLDHSSWKIQRGTEIRIVALTRSEDDVVAPELFRRWPSLYEQEYLPPTRAI